MEKVKEVLKTEIFEKSCLKDIHSSFVVHYEIAVGAVFEQPYQLSLYSFNGLIFVQVEEKSSMEVITHIICLKRSIWSANGFKKHQ